MIGIDTNVLVRVLVEDDERQTAAALRFLAERTDDDLAYVSAVVLAEFAWVLDRTYGYTTKAIHEAFDWLFGSANVLIERQELMQAAITGARANNADISDCIIAATAADAGATTTVTFDGPASRRVPGMSLLK